MEYRKFKADYLFDGSQILNRGHVLISDLKGKIIDIVTESEAGNGIEVLKGILSPGFINAHCHLELSHLKNKIPQQKMSDLEITNEIENSAQELDSVIKKIVLRTDELEELG